MDDAEGGGKKDKYGKVYKTQADFEKAAEAYWKKKEGSSKRKGGMRK